MDKQLLETNINGYVATPLKFFWTIIIPYESYAMPIQKASPETVWGREKL